MFRLRLLAAAVVLGAFAAFAASPAGAAGPVDPWDYPELITTQHFEIHYTGDDALAPIPPLDPPITAAAILHQDAGDLGALAEQAYTTEITNWGYPAPLNDGDGKIDIWVGDMSSMGAYGLAVPVAPRPSAGWIAIDPTAVGYEHVIAHELFHLVQFGIWFPWDSWLFEGTAEWVGFAADNFSPYDGGELTDSLAQPDMSLDCMSDACGWQAYEINGYSRWSFFEYLAERYGNTFLKDVFAAGAALASPPESVAPLASALTSKGETLSDLFNDYTAHVVAGDFQATALKGLPPPLYSTTDAGSTTAALGIARIAVNHLAARYLAFTRGTSGDTQPCHVATLALTVALPAGLGAKPYFYSSSVATAAVPLTISGNTASLNVPWDTCFGSADGYLSLSNPSLTADSQVFTVSASLSVDMSTPATAKSPPDPLNAGPGTVIPSPTADVAPSIFVSGAQIIRVSTADRMVRLIVFSSGPGTLTATMGKKKLGTYALRPGNNDVRFKLPLSLVNSLRKPVGANASSSSLLTLAFASPAGAPGVTVARKVTVFTPPDPKAAAHKKAAALKKAAAKKKAAAHKKAAASNR